MKKLVICTFIFALAFTLAGCGKKAVKPSQQAQPPAAQKVQKEVKKPITNPNFIPDGIGQTAPTDAKAGSAGDLSGLEALLDDAKKADTASDSEMKEFESIDEGQDDVSAIE